MNVVINGEVRVLPAHVSIDALVRDVAGRIEGTAAAINGEMVPRSAWMTTSVGDGDRIEILTARAGG